MKRGSSLPRLSLIPALIATAFFLLPLIALCARVPFDEVFALSMSPAIRKALWLSLECAGSATLLALLFGLPLAVWLAAGQSRLHALMRVLITLPMVLPPVVGGLALLLAFGRNGLVGAPLREAFGITLPFQKAGVIVAATYVAMPFFVLTVEGALRGRDLRFEEAAATMGARPSRIFRTVTLPLIAPGLRAGLTVAFARALGEFGATITFAGNLEGETRTMPLAVYGALETSPKAAIVLSLILVMTSGLILYSLRRQWFPAR